MLRTTLPCAAAVVVAVSLGGCGTAGKFDSGLDTSYIEIMGDEVSAAPLTSGGSVESVSSAAPLTFAGFADAGTFSSLEDGFYVGGVNAEQATAEAFDRGGAQDFSIEILQSTDTEQLLLVNRLGLALGPVEDERLLLLFRQSGGPSDGVIPEGLWRVVKSGRQQRCRGDGDSGWTSAPCI